MSAIAELKHNYKELLANRRTIPSSEFSPNIPISTGSPAIDSCLIEPIGTTGEMEDHEHLMRSWQLIKGMNNKEEEIALNNLDALLNDHKILLALKYWEGNDKEIAKRILDSLPFGWKLQFPLVLIKPSYLFFTGWKKHLDFRLVKNINYGRLQAFYSQILEEAGDIAILKYKEKIHATTALLGYDFKTDKEKAIEDWCYHKGSTSNKLELVKIYVKARELLKENKIVKFGKYLASQDKVIPITSYMGLLGSKGIDLRRMENETLRNYAIRCASFVETILRLNEWSKWEASEGKWHLSLKALLTGKQRSFMWLDEGKAELISKKIKKGLSAVDIPFSKMVKAYLACPKETKQLLTNNTFIPLLKKFGESIRYLLPKSFNFLQPANMIHLHDFILYNVLNSATKGKLVLLGKTVKSYHFSIKELAPLAHMDTWEIERYLVRKFGEQTERYSYSYEGARIKKALSNLNKDDLLVVDLPFYSDLEIMEGLMGFKKIFNLSTYYGLPSEISLQYQYFSEYSLRFRGFALSGYSRLGEAPAYDLIKYLEKLHCFEKFAGDLRND